MNQSSFTAITAMVNAFPQSGANVKALLLTYEQALTGVGDAAVDEACRRFIGGDVQGQSKTFAPSIAEFVQEARQRQEYIDIAAKPRIPIYRHHTGAPFYIRQEKTRTKYRECPIMAENLNLDEYRRRVKEFPEGHAWIAALATVFGPPAMEIARRA